MSKFIYIFLYLVLGVIIIVTLSVINLGVVSVTIPNTDIDSEIKELRVAQDKWVEQVELLIVIDRLSFNLQCSELDNKEMFRALGQAVQENNELRILVRSLFQQLQGNDQRTPPNNRTT